VADKRNLNRFRKRLAVRFGPDAPSQLAFSEDISDHGIFIKTGKIYPLGTILKIEITLPDDDYVFFEGMVRWTKKVPPQLISKVQKAGLGIKITKFIAGQGAFAQLVAEMHARRNQS
jgi:Tfp pilus assembly protein PilZ